MEKYIQLLRNSGASSAKVIDAGSIVTAPWVIFKCQFGCKNYGKKWCCPPRTPGFKATQEIIDCFKKAILFRCSEMPLINEMILNVSKELFFDGYYKVIAMGSGPCLRCKECNPEGCNHPREIIAAMEACGIDVFQTAHNNGFEISTLRNKGEIQNCFGLLLVE